MKEKLLALYARYGDILRYLIIGVLTTVLDLACFALFHSVLGLHYQVAKVLAWIIAVIFAFWGNKRIVFRSETSGLRAWLREAASFISVRLLTLGFSLLFMYIMVDRFGLDENLSNLLCNVFVVIFNYILSKLVVFRKKKQ